MNFSALPRSPEALQMMKHINALDVMESNRLSVMSQGLPGARATHAYKMAEDIMASAEAAASAHKMRVRYNLRDWAGLDVIFTKGGMEQTIPVPLVSGFTTRYGAKATETKLGTSFSQPGFVVPSYITVGEGGLKSRSLGDMITEQFKASMKGLEFGEEGRGLRAAKKSVFGLYKNAVWTANRRLAVPSVSLDTPAAILHAHRFQVLQALGDEPSQWKTLISMYDNKKQGKESVFRGSGVAWENILKGMTATRGAYASHNILQQGFSDLVFKPEAGIKGVVSNLKMGHIVPFGGDADPVRQAYQTWAVRPLVNKDAYRALTTQGFEAAAKAVSDKQFYHSGLVMFVDPAKNVALEKAISLSSGGAILSESAAAKMRYISPAGDTRAPGIASALIMGREKVTVAAMAKEISGGVEAIVGSGGLSKHADAVRGQVVSTILGSLGEVHGPGAQSKIKFLDKLADILGGSRVPGAQASIALSEKAQLGESELLKIRKAILRYNKGGWGTTPSTPIPEYIQEMTADISGAGGLIRASGAAFITSMGVRDKSELFGKDAVQWVVGASKHKAPGPKGMQLSYTNTKRGMKLSMRNVANMRLHGPGMEPIADIFLQAMAGYAPEHKKEIWRGLYPLLGPQRVAGGIKAETLSDLGIKSFEFGKEYYTAEELAGTLADPKRDRGIVIDLHKPFVTRGLKDEQIGVTQVSLPPAQTLRMGRKKILEGGKEHYVYRVNPLMRAEIRAFEEIQSGEVGPAVARWFETFGKAATGKRGLLSRYAQPRVGESGYLRIVPRGTGSDAKALGTELTDVVLAGGQRIKAEQTGTISWSTIKKMGRRAEATFRSSKDTPAGMAWMLIGAEPNQGPAQTQMVLMRAVEDSKFGPGALGLHDSMARLLNRDFDKDSVAALLLSGRRGQKFSYEAAIKTSAPDIANALAFAQVRESQWEATNRVGRGNIPRHSFEEWIGQAKKTLSYEQHMANMQSAEAVQAFFGTKKLAGIVDYKLQAYRNLLSYQTNNEGKKAAGTVLDILAQQAAIAKAKQSDTTAMARGIMDFMATATSTEGSRQQDVQALTDKISGLWEAVSAVKTGEPLKHLQGGGPAVFGKNAVDQIKLAAGALLDVGSMDRVHSDRVRTGLLNTLSGKKSGTDNLLKSMAAFIEAQATGATDAISGTMNLAARATNLDSFLADAANFAPGAGHAVISNGPIEQNLLNAATQDAGAAGKNLPAPILDGIINWFKNPKTPALHKAGVITGSALLGGAIVKNMLFPGYHPAEESSPTHVAVPIPLRMPAFDMPTESIFDDVPFTRTPVDSQFSMPLQYGNMGFRARPPAVQVGAGTLQPGSMPFLTGSLSRESPQAPMVLNHAKYQDSTPNPVPETVRVAAPRESMASSYMPTYGVADVGARFDNRALLNKLPGGTVRFEGYNDRSDREMLGMLEEQEMSNFT